MKPLENPILKVRSLCAAGLVAVWLSQTCLGQGTLQIGFDGPPAQAAGTSYTLQNYYESGMSFTPIDPSVPFAGFGRTRGGGQLAGTVPDNGTAYLDAAASDSLKFSFINDTTFGLHSVDLAGYSATLLDFSVHFVGYRPDGSSAATNFSGSGLNFQTFYFGAAFSGLSRVEIPTTLWCLDNLVVSIPEPQTGMLLLLSSGLIGLCRLTQRRR